MGITNKYDGEWPPYKMKCLKCGDLIYSKVENIYTSCKCGAIAVDMNRYGFDRWIGHPEDMEKVDDQENG